MNTHSSNGVSLSTLRCTVNPDKEDEFRAAIMRDLPPRDSMHFLAIHAEPLPHRSDVRQWVLTFSFANEKACEEWEQSVERDAAFAAIRPLLVEDYSFITHEEQSLKGSTEVINSSVPDDKIEEFIEYRSKIERVLQTFPGFVDVHEYPPSSQDDIWRTVIRFDSPDHLDGWLQSDQRSTFVEQISDIAMSRNRVAPTGFGQWFAVNATDMVQTPAWKQAMVVVAVLFAMVSVLNITLGNFVGKGLEVNNQLVFAGLGLPFPLVVFIGNTVGTILMTWVLMPIVTRVMNWWLRPTATSKQTWWGVALMLVIYAALILFFIGVNQLYGF